MNPASSDRRYERFVLVALVLLVGTLVGVLINAGMHPQLVA